MGVLKFTGHGANIVGPLGSGSLVQDMPTACQFPSATYAQVVSGATTSWNYLDGAATCSWSIWFKSSDDDNGRLFDKFNGWTDGNVFYSRIDSGALQGVIATDATAVTSQVPSGSWFVADTWQNWMVTYDGANVKGYLNGVLKDTDALTGALESGGTDQEPLNIAAFRGGSQDWDGELRDFRIWTSGLTAPEVAEVSTDVNMTGGTATSSLVGWWKMEEGTGTTLTDSSTETNNAIITGSTGWNKSAYNLNQISSGSVSGSVTVSGGTWNLRDSTYIDFNAGTDEVIELDGGNISKPTNMSTSIWLQSHSTPYLGFFGDVDTNDTAYFTNSNEIVLYLDGARRHVSTTDSIQNSTWYHVVTTCDGTTSKIYIDGVLDSTVTYDTRIDIGVIGGDSANNEEFNGFLRDARIYDSVLTDAQVDLLYKGQWDGAPLHWWKLNEGTSTTVSDIGTATANDGTLAGSGIPTWVKPDYDMLAEGGTAGALTTIAGTKLSAPQAELQLGQAGVHSIAADTYIHNSGTLLLDGNTGAGVNSHFYDYGNTYYKVIKTGSGWTHGWHSSANDDTIVENMFTLTQSNTRFYNRLTMGTTGSKGIIQIDGTDVSSLVGYGGFELYGVSELYPVLVSSSNGTGNWSLRASPTVLSNIEVDMDWTTFGDTITHTLSGNCKFAGLDISATDTFDASGQRVEIGGLDGASACTMDFTDSLVYLTARYDSYIYRIFNAATFTPTRSTFVCDMSNAGNALGQMQSDQSFDNLAIVNDGLNLASGYLSCTGNLIIAAGGGSNNKLYSSDGNSGINVSGNVSIANGATYEPDDDIATIGGNFNMAGGFIGVGALDVTGVTDVSAEYMTAAGFTGLVGAGEATIECWFRASDSSPESAGLVSLFPAAEWNINVNRSLDDLHLGWEWENGGTEIYKSNGPLLGPSDAQKWHHAVMTIHDTNGYEVYLDGKLEATGASLGNTADISEVALTVGSSFYSTNYLKRGFSGDIARASVWNAVLTQSEIRSMMFQDWSTMAGADVIDDSKCVAWYEFSDDQGGTGDPKVYNVSDMSGSGNTGTLSTGDAWGGPGIYTYGESTLKFDNAGTCNLYGEQDGTETDLYSIEVTNGTTLETYCRQNDFKMNSGSTMVNSGTLNSNRNWQYRTLNMPIVGASSDLIVGNNIWYYLGDGSGRVASGASTNYSQMRPGTTVWMQGDFDCSNGILQSGGDFHLNGYTAGTSAIWNYGGGNIWAEPGSSIEFDSTSGFQKQYGGNLTPTFIASGEAAGFFNVNPYDNTGNDGFDVEVLDGNDLIMTDAITMSAWLYPEMTGSHTGNPFAMVATVNEWTMEVGTTVKCGGYIYLDGDYRRFSSDAVLTRDAWSHVMVTYSSGSEVAQVYVNGVIQGMDTQIPGGLTSYGMPGTSGTLVISGWNVARGSNQAWKGRMSDLRVYDSALTSGNAVTLASINPATDVSGNYADSANALGAAAWWKLNGTASGTLDITDSVASNDGVVVASPRSGFVSITGDLANVPYDSINNIYPAGVTLQNTYMSGSKDIIVGQIYESTAGITAHPSQTFTTKGTVVLD